MTMSRQNKPKQKADEVLDSWIIEEIKRQEREKQRDDRPIVEIPGDSDYLEYDPENFPKDEPGQGERGIWEINIGKKN